jgi:hypothetical protein
MNESLPYCWDSTRQRNPVSDLMWRWLFTLCRCRDHDHVSVVDFAHLVAYLKSPRGKRCHIPQDFRQTKRDDSNTVRSAATRGPAHGAPSQFITEIETSDFT